MNNKLGGYYHCSIGLDLDTNQLTRLYPVGLNTMYKHCKYEIQVEPMTCKRENSYKPVRTRFIGKSLVDSLSILAGDGNTVQPLADAMTDLAVATSEVISGLSVMISKFKELPGVSEWINLYYNKILPNQYKPFLDIINFVRGQAPTPGMGGYPSSALGPGYIDPNDAARKKAEEEAAKRAKALAALQKKSFDLQKKNLALQKASKTLNLDAIGIEAALKGKISETDRLSLQLQKAILEGNGLYALEKYYP